jgi:hypothetical protein
MPKSHHNLVVHGADRMMTRMSYAKPCRNPRPGQNTSLSSPLHVTLRSCILIQLPTMVFASLPLYTAFPGPSLFSDVVFWPDKQLLSLTIAAIMYSFTVTQIASNYNQIVFSHLLVPIMHSHLFLSLCIILRFYLIAGHPLTQSLPFLHSLPYTSFAAICLPF